MTILEGLFILFFMVWASICLLIIGVQIGRLIGWRESQKQIDIWKDSSNDWRKTAFDNFKDWQKLYDEYTELLRKHYGLG
jgi:hypothetical protein